MEKLIDELIDAVSDWESYSGSSFMQLQMVFRRILKKHLRGLTKTKKSG